MLTLLDPAAGVEQRSLDLVGCHTSGGGVPPPLTSWCCVTEIGTPLLVMQRRLGCLTSTLLMLSQSLSNCFISAGTVSSVLTSDKSQAHAD